MPDGGCQLVECCREQFLTDGFESQPETRQLRRHWANLRGERRPRVVLRCVGAHVSESSLGGRLHVCPRVCGSQRAEIDSLRMGRGNGGKKSFNIYVFDLFNIFWMDCPLQCWIFGVDWRSGNGGSRGARCTTDPKNTSIK